jgi:hypothetical protein
MGDRANVGFRTEKGDILYLYQHWGGYQQLPRLAAALEAAGPRLTDPGYATRIVISRMIGDDWQSLTGHGIYINELADNEYPVPIVDFYRNTVSLHADNLYEPQGIEETPMWTMSIEDFVQSELSKHLTTVQG